MQPSREVAPRYVATTLETTDGRVLSGLSLGAATDGEHRILDIEPETLHGRTPLVFGSADKVARVARYHEAPRSAVGQSPLFGKRGLFRG